MDPDDCRHAPKTRGPRRGWYVINRDETWTGYAWDTRRRKYQGKNHDTRLAAEEWAQRRHAEFLLGQAQAGRADLNAVCEQLLDVLRMKGSRQSKGYAGHRTGWIDHICSARDRALEAGIRDLNDIDDVIRKTIELLAKLRYRNLDGGKPATATGKRNLIKVLRRIGAFAVKRRLIVQNPFSFIEKPRAPKSFKSIFTLDEIGLLVNPEHRDHPYYRVICSMLYAGLRPGEAYHQHHEWYRWDQRRIYVPESQHADAADGEEWDQKIRVARMTRLMPEHAEIMRTQANLAGPVFPHMHHQTQDRYTLLFNNYLAHCGVELRRAGDRRNRTPNSCRHNFACLMLASRESEGAVMLCTGHGRQTMMDHYSKQQDQFRRQVEIARWPPGELRLRDFSPGGSQYSQPEPVTATVENGGN